MEEELVEPREGALTDDDEATIIEVLEMILGLLVEASVDDAVEEVAEDPVPTGIIWR